MSVASILAPLFLQCFLAMILAFIMLWQRVGAVNRKDVTIGQIAVNSSVYPKPALLTANAFKNQFEFPLLFYLLTVLALITKSADFAFVIMAWIYVALRYWHAFIHITTNRLPLRLYVFVASVIVLITMWLIFAARILIAG